MLKHSNSLHSVLETIVEHALDSAEFCRAFDKAETACNLEPVVELEWPPHVRHTRHRMKVSETRDTNMWLRMAYAAELEKNGAGSARQAADEEDQLVGLRIASMVKLASLQEVSSSLWEFLLDRDFTGFTERTEDFFVAIHTILDTDTADLEQRVEDLEQSRESLQAHFDGDTLCGSALRGWPNGRLFIDEMNHELTQGKITLRWNSSLRERTETLKTLANSCCVDTDISIHAVAQAVATLTQGILDAKLEGVAKYVLTVEQEPLLSSLGSVLSLALRVWCRPLTTFLQAPTSLVNILPWHDQVINEVRQRALPLTQSLKVAQDNFV